MRKIIDDKRLIYQCCSLYYENNMGQNQIADYLGISKSSVSRMLQTGREIGIVEIKVHHVTQYMYRDLEKELMDKFQLRDAVVAESSPLDSKVDRFTKLGERAADYLGRFFRDGEYVGVSVGSMLYSVATAQNDCMQRDCTFVPVLGGLGTEGTQSSHVAEAFARKYGGKSIPLYVPALFSNEQLMTEFLKEDSVRYIFDYYEKLNTVVSGINGTLQNQTIERLGLVSHDQLEAYMARGAVGNFLLRFLDENGNSDKFEEFNRRVAGISMEKYRAVNNKILIAGGTGYSGLIQASIKGDYANVLIVDVDCAKELLSK